MGGFKKIPDRYSPFFDSLSDKKSREEHSRDQQEYFNPQNNIFSGQSNFEAIVLQVPATVTNGSTEENPDIKANRTRLRVKGLSEYTFSEPCEFKVPGEEPVEDTKLYNFVVSWHPIGLSQSTEKTVSDGDVVIVTHQQGPSFLGRQRGLTYDPNPVSKAPGYKKEQCSARVAMQAEEGSLTALGGTGGASAAGASGGTIAVGATTTYAGDSYDPALPASRPYTPRKNSGRAYNPRGPGKAFPSDKRGPDYNGPDGQATHPWQFVGAGHPTHPNRTKITAKFAQKRSTGKHAGVDIGHAGEGPGEPMYAVLDGTVVYRHNYSKSAGCYIAISHKGVRKDGKSNDFVTIYMHCEAIYVKKGEKVTKGQHVADMGNTGNSQGAHLHFELWLGVAFYGPVWNKGSKYRVNPTVVLGLRYAYSPKAKADVEANNGEVVSLGSAVVEGASPVVQVNAATGTSVSGGSSKSLNKYNKRESKQEGNEFVVDGIKYVSTPATDAAKRAAELRKTAKAAVPAGQYNKSFEPSPAGRKWVVENMYEIGRPGSGASWGPKLGTSKESYWSSWFFKVAYLNWWKEPGMDVGKKGGGYYYDYSADEALKQRNVVQSSPSDWVGKQMFIAFKPSEAPLYVGDSVWNDRSGVQGRFKDIAKGKASHMRVITKIVKSGDGYIATVNGGNESSKVGEGTFKMNTDRTMKAGSGYGSAKYIAVYKHVKIISTTVS